MRSTWTPALGPGPRLRAVEEAVIADIRRRRLVPGEVLPGTRALAERLGVSRGTITRAFEDLVAQGWLEAEPRSGFRVRADLSSGPVEAAGATLGFPLPPGPEPPPARPALPFVLRGGHPDLRLVPLTALARAYGRVLRGRGRRLVGYGDPGGERRLREALGGWLAETRGVRPDRSGLLVTRGSQMALFLTAHALFRPGDRVAVERLGYRPAWGALRSAGVELVPIDVDRDGLVVERLPDDVRGVYLTPHHQYPTGATLSASRRLNLLQWATAGRRVVVEDDYDHEFHFEGTPIRPLVAADATGVVVSIGTLSKAFAPGVRVGWVVAPPQVVERLIHWRNLVDRQGDRVVEHAVAELLEDGTLERHLRRVRRLYAERRAALRAALADALPELDVEVPSGGLALWARAPGVDVARWSAEAASRGVAFDPSTAFDLVGDAEPAARFGFPAHDPPELREAVARVAAALRAL